MDFISLLIFPPKYLIVFTVLLTMYYIKSDILYLYFKHALQLPQYNFKSFEMIPTSMQI